MRPLLQRKRTPTNSSRPHHPWALLQGEEAGRLAAGVAVFSLVAGLAGCIRISHPPATPQPRPKRKTQNTALKAATSGDTAPHGRAASDARLRSQRPKPCGTVHIARPRTTTVHKGLGKRKGCEKRYCVVGGTACRFRVEASFHPKFSQSRACDRIEMRARRCITVTQAGLAGANRHSVLGHETQTRDVMPTRQPSTCSIYSDREQLEIRKTFAPVPWTITFLPVRYQGLIVAQRGLGWWDAAQLLQLFEKKPSNIVR
jgi:hypothetical protein